MIFMGMLKATGYYEQASVQAASAVQGIRAAPALIPIAFCLVGMLPLKLFPYDKEKEQQLSHYSLMRRRGEPGAQPDPQ